MALKVVIAGSFWKISGNNELNNGMLQRPAFRVHKKLAEAWKPTDEEVTVDLEEQGIYRLLENLAFEDPVGVGRTKYSTVWVILGPTLNTRT